MSSVIAIVGRPNVGKSTLFNILTGSKSAIVADFSGLTRDRKYGNVKDSSLVLIDTSVCFPIDFLRLPFIALIAYILWDETFSPWVLLGALVIFASTYFSVRKEAKEAKVK